MTKQFNGKRAIGVLELSSTAIKRLIGIPKNFYKNPEQINRFKDTVTPFDLSQYITSDTKTLDLEAYEKHIIPLIIESIKYIQSFTPQSYRVILTGLYRNISNWNDFYDLLSNRINTLKRIKPLSIKLLDPEQESYLSFLSWFNTTTSDESESNTSDSFFMLNNGLNIDVGGGTTEITLIEKGSFEKTLSINLGSEILSKEIINTNFIDGKHLNGFLSSNEKNIYNEIFTSLKKNFFGFIPPKFCICSGSNIIIDGGDSEANYRKAFETKEIDYYMREYRSMVKEIFTYSYKSINKKMGIPPKHTKLIKQYMAYIIFKPIIEFFKVENYHINKANLRIGVFYDITDELKKLT